MSPDKAPINAREAAARWRAPLEIAGPPAAPGPGPPGLRRPAELPEPPGLPGSTEPPEPPRPPWPPGRPVACSAAEPAESGWTGWRLRLPRFLVTSVFLN